MPKLGLALGHAAEAEISRDTDAVGGYGVALVWAGPTAMGSIRCDISAEDMVEMSLKQFIDRIIEPMVVAMRTRAEEYIGSQK